MNKIETIKNQANWYTMDNAQGVILNPRDMGWEKNDHGCEEFIPFDELSETQLDEIIAKINKGDCPCHATYDEYYGSYTNGGEEICQDERTNIENSQRTVHNEFSLVEYAEADAFTRDWLTITNEYFDWTSIMSMEIEEQKEKCNHFVYELGELLSEEFYEKQKEAYEKLSKAAKELVEF